MRRKSWQIGTELQSRLQLLKPRHSISCQQKQNPPAHIEQGRKPTELQQNAIEKPSTSSDSVKYMASVDAWYDEVVKRGDQESDEDYRKRILKAIKQKLLESFRSGKAQR